MAQRGQAAVFDLDLARLQAILEAAADGITVQGPDGRLLFANAAAARMSGFESPEAFLAATPTAITAQFELFDEAGSPLSPAELPGRLALRGEQGPPRTIRFLSRSSGADQWSRITATPLWDERTGAWLAINTFHDVTEQTQAENRFRASEQRARELTEAMPQIAWVTDHTGSIVQANARWESYFGAAAISTRALTEGELTHPADQPKLAADWAQRTETGETVETTARLQRHDGAYRWHLIRAVALQADRASAVGWVGTATDIDDATRSAVGARLVADATARLDQDLNLEATVATAAELAVPALADWAVLDLIEPDGSIRRAAVAAHDPAQAALVARLRDFPTVIGTERPGALAIAERRPILLSDLDQSSFAGYPPELAETLVALHATSGLVLPLVARNAIQGILFLASSDGSHRYGDQDLEIGSELAQRVALGIANARAYDGERRARLAAESSARRTERFQTLTAALSTARTRAEVAKAVIEEGLAAGTLSVAIYLRKGTGDVLEFVAGLAAGESDSGWRDIGLSETSPPAVATRTGSLVELEQAGEQAHGNERFGPAPGFEGGGAALPLMIRGHAIGCLWISWPAENPIVAEDRDLFAAIADLCAQALDRVALNEIREGLMADLDAERRRLEAIIRQMPSGVIVAGAPSARVLLSNDAVERIWGGPFQAAADIAGYASYAGYHPDGRPYRPEEWPIVRSVTSGEVVVDEEMAFDRLDGSRGWMSASAAPVRDRDDRIVAGVVVFDDITERRQREESQRFLAEASQLMAGSTTDAEETIRRVAAIAVPRMADWCLVESLEPSGRLRTLAISHVDPGKVEMVRAFRDRYPPNPEAPGGPYAVARSGRSEMMSDIPPELLDQSAVDETYRKTLRELDIHSYMSVPLLAGGEVLGVMTFVGAESGRRFGAEDLAFAEDLAARAAAAIQNAMLFRHAARFQKILDATRDAVHIFDPDTLQITYVNDAVVEQLGISREQLVTMRPVDFDEDLDEADLRGLIQPLIDGTLTTRIHVFNRRRADGTPVPVEVRWQYLALPEEPARIVAVARDIRERVAAQERLEALATAEHERASELNAVIQSIGEGVVVCGPDGVILLANRAAEILFPALERRTYEAILDRLDDPDGAAPPLGVSAGPVELRVAGKGERWLELSTYPVPSESSDPIETIVVLRDATAARERQTVRDTFVGILSHELRTPVTTIYGGAKVLARRQSSLSEETRLGIFEDIHAEAERLHRLVEDVIALTRFGEGGGDVGDEPVLLQRVLPVVVASEQERWPGVEVTLELPADLPPVAADPTYVEQVARNLVTNAAKYAGAGAEIEIRAMPDGDEVVVVFLDRGPGFTADEADRLFDLFYRSPSTASTAAGAGIGLFVCARLMAAMKGRIWARPRDGGGAEFGFALRAMAEDD